MTQGISSSMNIVGASDVAQMGVASAGNLTPDALMVYMQTRLGSLDGQINEVFEKQNKSEEIRGLVGDIDTELAKFSFKSGEDNKPVLDMTEADSSTAINNINATLAEIDKVDPQLGQSLRTKLEESGALLGGSVTEGAVDAAKKLTGNVMKDIESSAQMDMIKLQSVMSARQTAVQLSTNLVSSLGETLKSIVSNTRG